MASGDKNILVLASDKDEQPGGGVDMAYMVKLENGTIANYTPVYPGGMTHPTKQALGGLEGPMRLHDCLWDGPEQGMEYAKEIVEANTGMHADAVVIIYDDELDAIIDGRITSVITSCGRSRSIIFHASAPSPALPTTSNSPVFSIVCCSIVRKFSLASANTTLILFSICLFLFLPPQYLGFDNRIPTRIGCFVLPWL